MNQEVASHKEETLVGVSTSGVVCLSVSFSQEGGATRNNQNFTGDLPSLGRMEPHFSPLGAAQR